MQCTQRTHKQQKRYRSQVSLLHFRKTMTIRFRWKPCSLTGRARLSKTFYYDRRDIINELDETGVFSLVLCVCICVWKLSKSSLFCEQNTGVDSRTVWWRESTIVCASRAHHYGSHFVFVCRAIQIKSLSRNCRDTYFSNIFTHKKLVAHSPNNYDINHWFFFI